MDNIAVKMLTEYRAKVLQETGVDWYHPENAFFHLRLAKLRRSPDSQVLSWMNLLA